MIIGCVTKRIFFHSVKMQNVTFIHNFHKNAALLRNIFAIFLNFCKPMLTLQFLLLFISSLEFSLICNSMHALQL